MTKSNRLGNIDIERILLTVLVIILHFNNRDMGGALNFVSDGPGREIFIRLTESLAICAVDAFVILSGYFASGKSISNNIKKAVFLLVTCSFYRVTGYILHVVLITHDLSIKTLIGYLIPSNWYVCLFVTLLLVSPYIIKTAEAMDDKAFNTFAGLFMFLFTVIPTCANLTSDIAGVDLNGLSTVTFTGDALGFNIALFVAMYILGMWLKRSSSYWSRFGAWFYLASYLLFSVLTSVVSRLSEKAWNYSCITVVMEAVCLTLFFTKLKAPGEKTGRITAEIAECSLGIFLWHTMPVMIFGFWSYFDIPGAFAEGSALRIAGTFAGAVFAMYTASLIWVLITRLCLLKPLRRLVF